MNICDVTTAKRDGDFKTIIQMFFFLFNQVHVLRFEHGRHGEGEESLVHVRRPLRPRQIRVRDPRQVHHHGEEKLSSGVPDLYG